MTYTVSYIINKFTSMAEQLTYSKDASSFNYLILNFYCHF